MDQQQTHQTEQMIAEILQFLETSSGEEYDLEPQGKGKCKGRENSIKKKLNCNFIDESPKKSLNTKKRLKQLKEQILKSSTENETNHEVKSSTNGGIEPESLLHSSQLNNLDWQLLLENHCRRNNNNIFTQEVYKAIYQNPTPQPRSGSLDYCQAAQTYALYGKHLLDFPKDIQTLTIDKVSQSPLTESSNFNNYLYTQHNIMSSPNVALPSNSGGSSTTAAVYYQILNNIQTQSRSALPTTNPGNSLAYGLFMGNKMTYLAGNPASPSLVYSQHNTTTTATNFIPNSLANAALATSPNILYTNPMLTTTTQQYLAQFLNAAALTSNSIQSTTVSANAGFGSLYERLIYAQLLQQQFYQAPQSATMPGMFQNNQRIGNQVARATANVINVSSNRSTPALPLPCKSNGVTYTSCYRPGGRSTSPRDLAKLKPLSSIALTAVETCDNSKLLSG